MRLLVSWPTPVLLACVLFDGRRLRGRPAAEQRGRWLAGQRAGAVRQLDDDRVLVDRGPDQAVLRRHLNAYIRLPDEELGRTAPDPVTQAGVGVPGYVSRHYQHRDLLLGQLLRDGLDAANRGRARPLDARGNQIPLQR